MADMADVDAYGELRALMRDLEARGVPVDHIIDCSFRLALGASARLYGTEAAAAAVLDMAEAVNGGPPPPPPGYRLH